MRIRRKPLTCVYDIREEFQFIDGEPYGYHHVVMCYDRHCTNCTQWAENKRLLVNDYLNFRKDKFQYTYSQYIKDCGRAHVAHVIDCYCTGDCDLDDHYSLITNPFR